MPSCKAPTRNLSSAGCVKQQQLAPLSSCNAGWQMPEEVDFMFPLVAWVAASFVCLVCNRTLFHGGCNGGCSWESQWPVKNTGSWFLLISDDPSLFPPSFLVLLCKTDISLSVLINNSHIPTRNGWEHDLVQHLDNARIFPSRVTNVSTVNCAH